MPKIKWFLIGVGCGLVPFINVKRGYDAIGGEILLPFLILMVWEMVNCVIEVIDVLKGGETDD
jgi:hypothetical protein